MAKRIILITLSFLFSLCAFATAESEKVENLFNNYFLSYKNKDLNLLKSITTESFFESPGGEKHWSSVLDSSSSYFTSYEIKSVSVKKDELSLFDGDVLFAQVVYIDASGETVSMDDDAWFIIKKNGEQLKLDAFYDDFYPNTLEKEE